MEPVELWGIEEVEVVGLWDDEAEDTATWLVSTTLVEVFGKNVNCEDVLLELVVEELDIVVTDVELDTAEVLIPDVEANEAVTDGVALEPARWDPREAKDEETAEITETTAVDASDASGVVLVVDTDDVVETGI